MTEQHDCVDWRVLSSYALACYCSFVEQDVGQDADWTVRMTAQIGARVAQARLRQEMTVQALADRCAELGLPIGRVTLTKLERGIRQAVSPSEVMVLAAALGVPPIELVLPIGIGEQMEILPGQMLDSLDAVRWFCGDLKLDVIGGVVTELRRPWAGEESSVVLIENHDRLAREWNDRRSAATRAALDAAAEGANERARDQLAYFKSAADDFRKSATEQLGYIRAAMRRRGMALPPVPLGLSLDDATPRDSAGDHNRGDGQEDR